MKKLFVIIMILLMTITACNNTTDTNNKEEVSTNEDMLTKEENNKNQLQTKAGTLSNSNTDVENNKKSNTNNKEGIIKARAQFSGLSDTHTCEMKMLDNNNEPRSFQISEKANEKMYSLEIKEKDFVTISYRKIDNQYELIDIEKK